MGWGGGGKGRGFRCGTATGIEQKGDSRGDPKQGEMALLDKIFDCISSCIQSE